jgi:hypothetical protein
VDIFIVSWRMIYRWPLFINREFIHDVLLRNHVFQPFVDCLIMEQKQICSFALTSYVASFGYSLCTWGHLNWFHYVYLFILFWAGASILSTCVFFCLLWNTINIIIPVVVKISLLFFFTFLFWAGASILSTCVLISKC